MVFWNDYKIIKAQNYLYKKEKHCADLLSFDTETTTFFKVGGNWQVQTDKYKYEDYSGADKYALVYIWQFAINDTVIFGRELKDFFIFLQHYCAINTGKKIVYVHNLGYDFSFLLDYLPADTKVFARAPHRPIYAFCKSLNLEFRCSYFLTNMSLEVCEKEFKLPINKKVGQLDYKKARTPKTPLTSAELEYCEYDPLVINSMIKNVFLPRYKQVANIPLTQTGEVRREVKNILKSPSYLKKIKNNYPDFNIYKILTRVLQGGYTHLNYLYEGKILNNLMCFDFASSYPFEMCTNKFPMGKFKPTDKFIRGDNNYSYLAYVLITDLNAIGCWNYIARHKCDVCYNGVVDNGKIMHADYVELWCTDIDLDIILDNYEFGKIEYTQIYKSFKDYLPRDLILYILNNYNKKTKLKGIESEYPLYMHIKQLINSIFGMCITNNITDEIIFDITAQKIDGSVWGVKTLTDSDIIEQLMQQRPFLNYAWGVWVTAYARKKLWYFIHNIGVDAVYCDTDSVKMLNGDLYLSLIDEYNKSIDERIKNVCLCLDIDKELFYPVDIKGKIHPLGYFEFDGFYNRFKSFGAKKYCYEENGKFKFVVAGLIKSYFEDGERKSTLNGFDDFKLNKSIKHGRSVLQYFENIDPPEKLTDYLGQDYTPETRSGIAMIDSNYTFTLSDDYSEFLNAIERGLAFDLRNKYTSPFRITTD